MLHCRLERELRLVGVSALRGTAERRVLRGTSQRKGLVLLTGAIAYVFAQDPDSSLVLLLASAYGVIAQFAPPVVAALYWRRATTRGIVAGLIAGALTAFTFWLNPELKPFDMHEGIIGLLVHIPVLVLVSLATKPQDEEHLAGFFE